MFGIGFFELLVVLGISVFLLDRDSVREIFRVIKALNVRLESLKHQCIEYFHSPSEVKSIVGDDDKVYEVFELKTNELEKEKSPEAADIIKEKDDNLKEE